MVFLAMAGPERFLPGVADARLDYYFVLGEVGQWQGHTEEQWAHGLLKRGSSE
jgi:hypothetical protein